MILVDASRFPGPAIWQGVMLLLTPAIVWGMLYKGGQYFWLAVFLAIAVGAGLMWWLLRGA